MNRFLTIIGLIALWMLEVFVYGTVLRFMWNWFITPLGLARIGFWLALGISLTITCFVGTKVSDEDNRTEMLSLNIMAALLIWGIGAIIHLFI